MNMNFFRKWTLVLDSDCSDLNFFFKRREQVLICVTARMKWINILGCFGLFIHIFKKGLFALELE